MQACNINNLRVFLDESSSHFLAIMNDMKRNIIFISGFGGAGKTTCGAELFDRLSSAALLEADWFFTAKPLSSVDEKIYRLKLNGCDAIIRNYYKEGFRNIIVVGYVWSHRELEAILKKLKSIKKDVRFFLFWLQAPKTIRHRRVLSRPDETVSRKWLENVEKQIKNPWPFDQKRVASHKIEVENKRPAEIVDDMLSVLGIKDEQDVSA